MYQNDNAPLLAEFQPDRLICITAEHSVSQSDFLYTVNLLARQFPDGEHFINLCQHRYHFLLVFCAVIVKGGINILPPNRNQATIEQIREDYPNAVCIRDDSVTHNISDIELLPLLSKIMSRVVSGTPEVPMIDNEHVIAIAYTSGSTGRPRPNEKTWRILSGTAKLLCRRFLADSAESVLVPTVPAQHMYGLETSIMMVLQGRSVLYAGDTFYPEDIVEAFKVVKKGILITTPIHLLTLNKSSAAIEGIEKVICATAPLKLQLSLDIETQYNTVIEEIYGFTEAGSVATRKTTSTDDWSLLDEMVIDAVAVDEFLVNGPQFSSAVQVLDIIELFDNGKKFRLCGRSEDLLNVAGKRASLADLNFKLAGIDGVEDGVLFMPDEVDDITRPLGIVVSGLRKRDILRELSKLVDPVFLPRPLIFVDNIPRNETGKPQRLELLKIVDTYARRDT